MEGSVSKKEENGYDKHTNSKAAEIAFLVWGILCFLCDSLALSGTQDVLAGTQLQTSTVFFCWASSSVIAMAVGPNIIIRTSYILSISLMVLLMLGGILTIATGANVNIKLIGDALIGTGTGFGCSVALCFSTLFRCEQVRQAFSAGSALGELIGTLYYTAMTTWICVSPTITLLIMTPLCLLAFVCFYVIDKNLDIKISRNVIYTKLQNSSASGTGEKIDNSKVTIKTKLSAIMTLCIYIAAPTFLGFFSEYLLIQSIVSTLAYENSPFRPRDHFQYYYIMLWFGEVIARSHRAILGAINAKYLYTVTLKNLWILAIIEVLHMLVLFCEAWYRFLPGVGIVLLLCFTAGVFIDEIYLLKFVGLGP
ncbi:Protein btn-1 [Exaiptasia diaphana]|nr:Protein btn-1 [Exaiptasia diaphana]